MYIVKDDGEYLSEWDLRLVTNKEKSMKALNGHPLFGFRVKYFAWQKNIDYEVVKTAFASTKSTKF